jgi:hypothetical protein
MRDAFPRVALLLVLLSGCAMQPGQVESASTAVAVPVAPAASAGGDALIPGAGTYIPPALTQPAQSYSHSIQESGAGPAVLSLYRQAQDARAAGHPDQAGALLDRAVHIDARNPWVWQAVAGVRMDQKQYDQVEAAALKSNSLAHGNPYVESGNWRQIASARQARGDSNGALQAQARVEDIARAISN